jgi:hypothetical protein
MKATIMDMCILSHKTQCLIDVRTRGGRRRRQEEGFAHIYRTVNDYTAHSINHVTYLFLALHVTIFLRFIALATSAQLLCLWCHYMSLAELAGGEIEGTTPKLAYWCLLMMLCLFGKKKRELWRTLPDAELVDWTVSYSPVVQRRMEMTST